MRKSTQFIFSIFLAFVLAAQFSFAKSPERDKIDPRIESVLHWLPADTDSIAVLQSPVTYDVESDQPIDPESVYESPFVMNTLICSNEVPYSDEIVIPNSEFSLCVQSTGRWHNLPNEKFGTRAIGYFNFLSTNPARDEAMVARCERNALSKRDHTGQRIYEFVLQPCYDNGKPKQKTQSLYKCFPKPGLVIVTNDAQLMQHTLCEMAKEKSSRRALPEQLPEWKVVNMREKYWGLRHFQADDPTSPLSTRLQTVPDCPYPTPDAQAIGLVFAYNPSSQIVAVHYLSSNPKSTEIVRAMTVKRGFGNWGHTEIKLKKHGIVQMKVRNRSREDWNGALDSAHPWLGAPPPWPTW